MAPSHRSFNSLPTKTSSSKRANHRSAPEETIEIYAYLEAAELSKCREGQPASIAEVLQKAQNKYQLNKPNRKSARPNRKLPNRRRLAIPVSLAILKRVPLSFGGSHAYPTSDCHEAFEAVCFRVREDFGTLRFTLKTVKDDRHVEGAIAGPYRVIVAPPMDERQTAVPTTLPELFTVEPGENEFTLEIEAAR